MTNNSKELLRIPRSLPTLLVLLAILAVLANPIRFPLIASRCKAHRLSWQTLSYVAIIHQIVC